MLPVTGVSQQTLTLLSELRKKGTLHKKELSPIPHLVSQSISALQPLKLQDQRLKHEELLKVGHPELVIPLKYKTIIQQMS